MLDELCERLVKGGYSKDTPAAIVYKATWPEEIKIITTIENLPRIAKEKNITKTALILVGDVINTSGYAKSKLYSADFSTEFRSASKDTNT